MQYPIFMGQTKVGLWPIGEFNNASSFSPIGDLKFQARFTDQ